MSYPFIDFSKAKKDELIDHLKTYCGIEPKSNDTKEQLIDAILDFEAANGYQRNASQVADKPADNGEASSDVYAYPKVRIIIQTSDKFDGQDDVLVWINGYSFQMKRGVEVIVPEPVYTLLAQSKTTVYQQEREGSVTEKTVPNYAIQFLGYA